MKGDIMLGLFTAAFLIAIAFGLRAVTRGSTSISI